MFFFLYKFVYHFNIFYNYKETLFFYYVNVNSLFYKLFFILSIIIIILIILKMMLGFRALLNH
jgi:hypothetical protein